MSASLLNRYRDVGYAITREGNALRVRCEHEMSERMRGVFKAKKAELLRELAIEAARPCLDEYRAALVLGHLSACCNCEYFLHGTDPAGLGQCQRYDVEAAPFVPFPCPGFEASDEPAAVEYLPPAEPVPF
jgi:hypothetical protein